MNRARRRLLPFAAPILAVASVGCAITLDWLRQEPAGRPTPQQRVENALAEELDLEMLVIGARTFEQRCSPCHGDTGHGDGVLAGILPIRPRNYHDDVFKWGNAVGDIAATVRLGRSGTMPSFEGALSEEEIWAVAYLVWHWVPRESIPRAAPGIRGAR